ncbi:hypothetical protein CYMTET_18372 [Cymbomonas tetramitiformis]|uniref:Uncharacterized protein n=1 Tax=Cymbomonas tetramitiformis TaxID=36881 RepID=A0AAE0G858_9CHLO|nr:hypothetical protein CYMTET_18372 [Cymbomonas tetramitiformis]
MRVPMGSVKSEVGKENKAKVAQQAVQNSSFDKLGVTLEERSTAKLSKETRAFHTRNFVVMCVVDLRPPEMRYGIGYQFYMAGFNSRWATEPPHHHTLDKVLLEEYAAAKETAIGRMKEHLKYVKYGPAMHGQLDLWTSSNGEPYGAFSVCYVDLVSGERERICLAVRLFPGEHTSKDCSQWMKQLCFDFGINPEELVEVFIAGSTDGAGKELNAFAKELDIPCKVCLGHRLNFAVQWTTGIAGTPPIAKSQGTIRNPKRRTLIGRVAGLVGHFAHSPKATGKFKAVMLALYDDFQELESRNDTRRSSTFKMLAKVWRLRTAISVYFNIHDGDNKVQLTLSEWNEVRACIGVLEAHHDVHIH